MLTRRKNLLFQIVLFAVLCIQKSASLSDASNDTSQLPLFRLPTALQPTRYYLHITTNIHQDILTYDGNVTIDLTASEPTDEILLHAKQLRELAITFKAINKDHMYEDLQYNVDNQTDILRIFSPTHPLGLQKGEEYRLEILYVGEILQQHFGFYRTIYKDEHNISIPLATTQFEPTSARLAFPCFDEPAFKARFVISITHGSNYSAISNMPKNGDPIPTSNGEMATTTFIETPIMPTYLIAFVVSNYNHIQESANGIEHRIFFPPNCKDRGYRALKNAIKSVTALENYLGIKYPLPKLDHIKVDKSYGLAMENWGLITYNGKHFLSSVENIDKPASMKMASLQNHEIAHQWFGNLVSPKWWTYAWLNEGFATYFGYLVTDLVYPDWRIMEYFIEKEVDTILHWPITHAMTHYVEKEADIKSMFDVVSYQKAASFIKMFHHAIGHKTFIKGVALYLTRFQYSVADEEDLFGALQTAIDEDEFKLFQNEQSIATVMHTWTHNQGIPIVTVIRNFENGTITIRQNSNSKNLEEKWWIPLNFATASDPNFDKTVADYILPPQYEVTIDPKDINLNLSNNDWLIVNKQQTGLFFVIYDEQNLELLTKALNSDYKSIHMLNRALLFRDLAEFIDKNHGKMEPMFAAIKYLQSETELMPWNTAADLILELESKLYGSKAHEMYKSFIRETVGDIFHKVLKQPKSEQTSIDSMTRAKVLEVACKVDFGECLNYTKSLANDYFFNGVEIENALRDICLCQGIKYATSEEFQRLVAKMVSLNISSVAYDDIIYSIRCVESTENLKYFLKFIFSENSTHDVMSDFEKMQFMSFLYVSNYFSRPVILEFMRDNYKTLFKNSNVVTITLARISNYVSEDDGQKEEFLVLLDHVKEFFQGTAKIQDSKIGSRIRERENFRRKYEKSITSWLKNNEIEKAAKSNTPEIRPLLTAARYVVAAGFISNLVSFV